MNWAEPIHLDQLVQIGRFASEEPRGTSRLFKRFVPSFEVLRQLVEFADPSRQPNCLRSDLNYIRHSLTGICSAREFAMHPGKSRMIEHLVATAAARRAEAGLEPNPYQIIVFELDKTTSVAAFYRGVLSKIGDEHWDSRALLDELEERVLVLSRKLGVEGLVGDEVQHLDRKTTNATQVTDRFKTFLNRGVLPLILVGDEEAETFFKKNTKFASRLGTPLTLKPLDVRATDGRDRKLFLEFSRLSISRWSTRESSTWRLA